MSKGRYVKTNSKKVPLLPIIVTLCIILIVLVVLILFLSGQNKPNTPSTGNIAATEETNVVVESDIIEEPEYQPEPVIEDTDSTEPTEEMEETTPETTPATTVIIEERAKAEYEEWLSAAMIVCVSMEYPDFNLEGVYAASATALDDKFSSDGAYIVFTSLGNRVAIHAKALEQERTDPGTVDISTEVIGFASFDQINPDSIDFASLEELNVNDMNELISQSLLISIYTH